MSTAEHLWSPAPSPSPPLRSHHRLCAITWLTDGRGARTDGGREWDRGHGHFYSEVRLVTSQAESPREDLKPTCPLKCHITQACKIPRSLKELRKEKYIQDSFSCHPRTDYMCSLSMPMPRLPAPQDSSLIKVTGVSPSPTDHSH